MIVWLASFPRSGNTYLRIALSHMFGVRSSVAYDFDGVARRLGDELVGFEADAGDREAQRRSGVHFIKTHRQRDERIGEGDRAICLVRDGRDAVVSYARQLSEDEPGRYETELANVIGSHGARGTGGWGANVLSWLRPARPDRMLTRFEDLVRTPAVTVRKAMAVVAPTLTPLQSADIPGFGDLSKLDAGFFRRGVSGAWRDEMPEHLHDLFWANAENRAAMEMLGYAR